MVRGLAAVTLSRAGARNRQLRSGLATGVAGVFLSLSTCKSSLFMMTSPADLIQFRTYSRATQGMDFTVLNSVTISLRGRPLL